MSVSRLGIGHCSVDTSFFSVNKHERFDLASCPSSRASRAHVSSLVMGCLVEKEKRTPFSSVIFIFIFLLNGSIKEDGCWIY